MKHKKENAEILLEQLAFSDDQAIADCMTAEIPAPRQSLSVWQMRRKVIGAVAACAVFALTAAAVLLLPMMRNDEPSVPGAQGELSADAEHRSDSEALQNPVYTDTMRPEDSETEKHPVYASLSYRETPVVKLTALAEDKTTLMGESGGSFDASYLNRLFFRENMLLAFDFEPDETVTVTSQKGGINPMIYPDDYYAVSEASHAEQLNWIKTYCNLFSWKEENCVESHILTSDDAFIMWNTTEAETYGEDILTFVIRNTEGQITGAGSVLMVKYHPVANPEDCFYDKASLVRWSVLGSVRFDHPEEVTAEAVDALLSDMNAEVQEVKAALSFDPENAQERYVIALADAMNASYTPEQAKQVRAMTFWTGKGCSFYKVEMEDQYDGERHFLIFADGTWGELKPESYWVQISQPDAVEADYYVYFTDGRSVRLDDAERNDLSAHVVEYFYHFSAYEMIPPETLEQIAEKEFRVAYDSIVNFLFNLMDVDGAFSSYRTEYNEALDFREITFDTEEGQFRFMVFFNGSWGLIETDTGYTDEEAMTGREITFSNGLSFTLEWQEVTRRGKTYTVLAPVYHTVNP